jgi:hypothetical protein
VAVEVARAKVGTVTVVNASQQVQRLIQVCGLGDAIQDDRDDSLPDGGALTGQTRQS